MQKSNTRKSFMYVRWDQYVACFANCEMHSIFSALGRPNHKYKTSDKTNLRNTGGEGGGFKSGSL
jgi:hypothetical protein